MSSTRSTSSILRSTKKPRERAGELAQADGFEDGLRVAIHRRAVTDHHLRRAESQKRFASRGDYGGMRVHHAERIETDEIRLEQNGLAANGEIEFAERFEKHAGKIGLIIRDAADRHARLGPRKRWQQRW